MPEVSLINQLNSRVIKEPLGDKLNEINMYIRIYK